MSPNEERFWAMVEDLTRLSREQAERLYELMWTLDWEIEVEKFYK
jgi:hypothetical protein